MVNTPIKEEPDEYYTYDSHHMRVLKSSAASNYHEEEENESGENK